MNYRHAYHAGNFADVLKHAVLALVIEHLKKKPAPFRVIDTHAGRGLYDLRGIEAGKTGEWHGGVGRLVAEPIPAGVAELCAPYLAAVASVNPRPLSHETLLAYPGSPAIARHLMRREDKLLVNELHPEDADALARHFKGDRQTKVLTIDAWQALKAALPPPERRGVILIDPPFEEPGEFARIAQGLREIERRFETGIVLMWYPIKDGRMVAEFRHRIAESGVDKVLDVTLGIRAETEAGPGLGSTGLMIVNPPYGLDASVEQLTRFLAERLAYEPGGRAQVGWLVPERSS